MRHLFHEDIEFRAPGRLVEDWDVLVEYLHAASHEPPNLLKVLSIVSAGRDAVFEVTTAREPGDDPVWLFHVTFIDDKAARLAMYVR